MPIVTVNDIRIYYEIHGAGEPLVLILGFGQDVSQPNNQKITPGRGDSVG